MLVGYISCPMHYAGLWLKFSPEYNICSQSSLTCQTDEHNSVNVGIFKGLCSEKYIYFLKKAKQKTIKPSGCSGILHEEDQRINVILFKVLFILHIFSPL